MYGYYALIELTYFLSEELSHLFLFQPRRWAETYIDFCVDLFRDPHLMYKDITPNVDRNFMLKYLIAIDRNINLPVDFTRAICNYLILINC